MNTGIGMSMSEASYARDKKALENLISDFQGAIDKASEAIKGQEFNSIIQKINKYWVGNDAQAYINELKGAASQLQALFKAYKSTVQKMLYEDYQRFEAMQNKNMANIYNNKISIK